jgi:hypothetical protein
MSCFEASKLDKTEQAENFERNDFRQEQDRVDSPQNPRQQDEMLETSDKMDNSIP